MKTLTFCAALAGAMLLQIFTAGAQSIVVDRMTPGTEANLAETLMPDRRLRFAIDAGYSCRIGKFVDGIPREFRRQMRSGFNFGAELTWFPTQMWGFGAKYAGRMFNAEIGSVRDDLDLHYFAPVVVTRLFDKRNRNAWIFGLSIGYLSFKERMTSGNGLTTVSEDGVGSSIEAGYDIRLSKSTFIGLKLSATSGSVTIDPPGGERQKENAGSLDFSVGLRF